MPHPGSTTGGSHRVPGDKSITHRALMLASLAVGRSRLTGALTALDARSTASVLRLLGARISPLRTGAVVTIEGRGGFARPSGNLHCGNSGTTARLLLGLLAGHPIEARVTGDRSLRRRPMARVTDPLEAMGARITAREGRLPLTIQGGRLRPFHGQVAVASAQVKSALLLAGAAGRVAVTLEQPAPTRDHTERLLSSLGYTITTTQTGLHFEPTGEFRPLHLEIPGDPSSAAFLLAAALLGRRGLVRIAAVGCNPSRTGFLGVLARMGAVIGLEPVGEAASEPVADFLTAPTPLRAVRVEPALVPAIIDELPILAVLAARAEGESRFAGLGELRVKESDRLALLATNLRAVGVEAEAQGDDLIVLGTDRPLGGRVATGGDHRIAMAFGVLGQGGAIEIDDPACAAVSFPGFWEALAAVRREVSG